MRRVLYMMLAGAIIGLVLAACSGGTGGAGGGAGLTVEMGDLYFKPNTLTVKPGQTLQITLDNRGSLEHNFVLYDADGKTVLFEKDAVQPGQKVNVSLKAPEKPGTYQYVCTVPGHKEGGMVGTLTVQP
ncbi:Auracyanin-A [Candidatus Thermoflexus japonica]|uniref:Auracyanin-A n=1 Tax=Candidatus Thermoflexus japonica TaxID=2035417 RepID=A0A2H5Y665_9CHLR|nr:Auracyanin-A [Candidatus Thermoflexus japonica]